MAELRLPPNALAQQRALGLLDVATAQKIQHGGEIFRDRAGCAECHDPDAERHPFTDNRNYGRGADWLQTFVHTYDTDRRCARSCPMACLRPWCAPRTWPLPRPSRPSSNPRSAP